MTVKKIHCFCSSVKFSWLIPLFNQTLKIDCVKEKKKEKKLEERN